MQQLCNKKGTNIMEININNETFAYGIVGIIGIFIIIVAYTEIGPMLALALIISVPTAVVCFIKAQQAGMLQPTGTLMTQIKNDLLRKRVKNPKLRPLTQKEYEEYLENKRKSKFKINW